MQLTGLPAPFSSPTCRALPHQTAVAVGHHIERRRRGEQKQRQGPALRAVADKPGEGAGAGVIERPGLDLSEAAVPQTDQGYGSTESGGSKTTGGGKHRVLLLDSEKHTEAKVVETIIKIVSGVEPEHARNCFNTSKELGQAIIISVLKEMAEFYAEQLNKEGVRSTIEPDSTVI